MLAHCFFPSFSAGLRHLAELQSLDGSIAAGHTRGRRFTLGVPAIYSFTQASGGAMSRSVLGSGLGSGILVTYKKGWCGLRPRRTSVDVNPPSPSSISSFPFNNKSPSQYRNLRLGLPCKSFGACLGVFVGWLLNRCLTSSNAHLSLAMGIQGIYLMSSDFLQPELVSS